MSIGPKIAVGIVLLFPLFWGIGEIGFSKSYSLAIVLELFGTILVATIAAILLGKADDNVVSHASPPAQENPYEFNTVTVSKSDNKSTKSLELVGDNIKQFLTLTTAVLTVTTSMVITNKFLAESAWYVKVCYFYAWLAQISSMLFGVVAHMKIVGLVHSIEKGEPADVYDAVLIYFQKRQQILFAIGVFFTVACACFLLLTPRPQN